MIEKRRKQVLFFDTVIGRKNFLLKDERERDQTGRINNDNDFVSRERCDWITD